MKNEKQILKQCFNDVIWMAIRYAHGRSTYAPSMVRSAIKDFKKVFPDWELKRDDTIEPYNGEYNSFNLREDYLNDLFKNEKEK